MNYLKIKRKKDFEKILKNGKRAFSESLTIVYLKDTQRRMAVCVGRKFGKSVARNKIKRLLREAFRLRCDHVKPCSFLLIPRIKEEYSLSVFLKDLERILAKERLFES